MGEKNSGQTTPIHIYSLNLLILQNVGNERKIFFLKSYSHFENKPFISLELSVRFAYIYHEIVGILLV